MFGTVLQLKRIFLLEDDMSLRRGIAMALESPEVSVIQAGCIGEAESALGAGEQFDLKEAEFPFLLQTAAGLTCSGR